MIKTDSRGFRILNYMNERDTDKRIKGKYALTLEHIANHGVDKDMVPTIPAETTIQMDFSSCDGMYAFADVNGGIVKVKIMMRDLHKIYYPDLDGEVEMPVLLQSKILS